MDTQDQLLIHIQSRINRIESCYVNRIGMSATDSGRLDELSMMLEVLRNANNLARLLNAERVGGQEPTIEFHGNKPQ